MFFMVFLLLEIVNHICAQVSIENVWQTAAKNFDRQGPRLAGEAVREKRSRGKKVDTLKVAYLIPLGVKRVLKVRFLPYPHAVLLRSLGNRVFIVERK